MYLQWGFTEGGVELIFCSTNVKNIDFDRTDVYTVFVDEKEE